MTEPEEITAQIFNSVIVIDYLFGLPSVMAF